MNYKTEKISFKNQLGQTIDARLERPIQDIRSFALFAHCFTCSKDVHAATRVSRSLTDLGIAVLRFDFTGLGNSDGDFANTNFSSNVADLLSAYEFLSETHDSPQILIGHSLGGAAVLAAAASMPSVRLVTTIGAPSDVTHVERLLSRNIEQIEKDGQATVSLGGRQFVIKKQFLDDLRRTSLTEKIKNLSAALLVFHSPLDQVVSIDNAHEIYMAAHHPKSLICLEGATHLLDRREDSEYVADVMASWCRRYLGRN